MFGKSLHLGIFSDSNIRTFKSDRFHLLHPYGYYTVAQSNGCDEDFVKTCKDNTKNIRFSNELKGKWMGGVIVFPSIMDTAFDLLVSDAINAEVKKLKREYQSSDDVFDTFSLTFDGSMFSAVFRNRSSEETFCEKSVAVFFYGTSSYTLDYLAERIFDYVVKRCESVKSMLVCDMNDGDFYQYAISESYVYRRPFTERHSKCATVYPVFLPKQN